MAKKSTQAISLSNGAWQLLEYLKKLLISQNKLFLEIGRVLKLIRDNKLYKELGDGGYDTWLSFLGSGELGLKQSTIYAYIRIYEVYIEKLGFELNQVSQIPWDKLYLSAKKIENLPQQQAFEWLEKTKVLSRSDLLIELGERTPEGESKIRWAKLVLHDCGKYKLEFEKELCNCLDK